MPNVKSLAEQALEELGNSAYSRREHEMINGSEEDNMPMTIEKEAWEHKPIKRMGKR